MDKQVLLVEFFNAIETDPRVNSRHISLYTSLFLFWINKKEEKALELYSKEVMNTCKISASSTYHKTIRELHEFGYIIYDPSFNHNHGSRVHLLKLKNKKNQIF